MGFTSKHDNNYAKIRDMAYEDGPLPRRPVDLDVFHRTSFKDRVTSFLTTLIVPVMMRVLPFVGVRKAFGLYWVTSNRDVRAVLADHKAFASPFGLEMQHITKSVTFCLGDDGELHARQTAALKIGMDQIDEEQDVRQPTRMLAEALLEDCGGQINIASDLIRTIVARMAADLLGCRVENHKSFSDSLIAVGTLLFADPYGRRYNRDEGLLAGRVMQHIIKDCTQRSFDASKKITNQPDLRRGREGKLILSASNGERVRIMPGMAHGLRLHQGRQVEEGKAPYSDQDMKNDLDAIGYGMTTGFAVTHNFFAGILQTYGQNHELFKAAKSLAHEVKNARLSFEQASKGDDEEAKKRAKSTYLACRYELERHMLEASRFNPAISPGSFRVRTGNPLEDTASKDELSAIPYGATVIVCTHAAMQDRTCTHPSCANPKRFDPSRLDEKGLTSSLGFGYGLHHCLGAQQAIAIASETLVALLTQPGIRFAEKYPRLKSKGPVPDRLDMEFDPDTGALRQTQILAALPLVPNCEVETAKAVLRRLQDNQSFLTQLRETKIIHFASLNVVQLGKWGKETPHLLVQFDVDGRGPVALDRIKRFLTESKESTAALTPLVELLSPDLREDLKPDLSSAELFCALVGRNAADLTPLPWGNTGLTFVGTGEFSIAQMEKEEKLAGKVFEYLAADGTEAANEVGPARAHVEEDWATTLFKQIHADIMASRNKFKECKEFKKLMYRVPGRGPAFARARQVSFREYQISLLKSRPVMITAGLWIALSLVALLSGGLATWGGLVAYVVVFVAPLAMLGTIFAGLALRLRHHEETEHVDDRRVDIDRLRAIRASEERKGHAQTHITSVSPFKLGLFRRLTFSIAMMVIKSFVVMWFRPGFLTDFATIHYARWVRLKGTDQLIFQANYDGSWESYLEDFITKVHQGQTLAWNNAIGFPKTKWLYFQGAEDGDKFKRWVRNQQVETPFWYCHFEDLTIHQIHRNALVRDGLARASDVADHRAWLKLFGSVPRNGTELEHDQIQSLMFCPYGRHELAACVPVRFEDSKAFKTWLNGQLQKSQYINSASTAVNPPEDLTINEQEIPCPVLTFGDGEPGPAAMFIAFSSGGLSALELEDEPQSGLNTFPSAFLDGMSGRIHALNDPAQVKWRDEGWNLPLAAGSKEFRAHAVLLIYVQNPSNARQSVPTRRTYSSYWDSFFSTDQEFFKGCGLEFGTPIDLSRPHDIPANMGGFNFKEGASQPIIKGTRAVAKRGATKNDVLAAGEFILGYEDLRGFVPPTIHVRDDRAARACLPLASEPRPEPYPYFGEPNREHMFDLGRNGSFLVVRQLMHKQDSEGRDYIEIFVKEEAKRLARRMRIDAVAAENADMLDVEADPVEDTAENLYPGKPAWSSYTPSVQRLSVHQSHMIFSHSLDFLESLVRAKMMGRWPDGSSLVRHPVLSATALLRRRTFRELSHVFLGTVAARQLEEEITKTEGVTESGKRVFDALLWNDALWDSYVNKLRNGIHVTAQQREKVRAHPWLKPHRDWPSVADNDFNFGRDDPQGLACPIGSHVRRSNPRDTPNPDNSSQFELNNRHRILRRGRPYGYAQNTTPAGTHFMCFNANIERQYEFVQRTWLNARDFQGLVKQPDPIAAPHKEGDHFVIPHTSNLTAIPLKPNGAPSAPGTSAADATSTFTHLSGGGYFFLPSRAALAYLAHPDRMTATETATEEKSS